MSLITFPKLKESFKNLHTKDPDILSRIGLKKLQGSFSAYSIRISDNSVIILMPESINPAKACELTEHQATSLITVLGQRGEPIKKWVKIWPEERTEIDEEPL